MEYLFFSSIITVILLVWFKSDGFLEYGKLFGLKRILKSKDYEFEKFNNIHLSYPLFLKMKYPNFFFKLIGCKLCLSIWLSGIASIFLSSGFLSLVSNTSVLTLLSLFMFGVIAKYLNEN
jgi:hypothetical protein